VRRELIELNLTLLEAISNTESIFHPSSSCSGARIARDGITYYMDVQGGMAYCLVYTRTARIPYIPTYKFISIIVCVCVGTYIREIFSVRGTEGGMKNDHTRVGPYTFTRCVCVHEIV